MVTWVMSDVWEASASHIPIHAVPSTQATARNGSIATQGLTRLVHSGTAASCLFPAAAKMVSSDWASPHFVAQNNLSCTQFRNFVPYKTTLCLGKAEQDNRQVHAALPLLLACGMNRCWPNPAQTKDYLCHAVLRGRRRGLRRCHPGWQLLHQERTWAAQNPALLPLMATSWASQHNQT